MRGIKALTSRALIPRSIHLILRRTYRALDPFPLIEASEWESCKPISIFMYNITPHFCWCLQFDFWCTTVADALVGGGWLAWAWKIFMFGLVCYFLISFQYEFSFWFECWVLASHFPYFTLGSIGMGLVSIYWMPSHFVCTPHDFNNLV